MINIVGTSHVSQESIERIDEAFEGFDPDVVCLELDRNRLNALLADERSTEGMNLVHRGLALFQRYIGGKTGVMPGEEMKYAFETAQRKGLKVYLIDQDIRQTLGRLKAVRRKEKVKAFAMLPLSFFGATRFDYREIPGQKQIDQLLEVFEQRFPELYHVFVDERNLYMAQSLRMVQEKHSGDKIMAIVGAAHKTGLEEYINEISSQSPMEETRQSTLES
jgi:pheromone shutdown protein TraB